MVIGVSGYDPSRMLVFGLTGMLGEEEDLEGQPVNPRTLDQEWSVTVQEERICYVYCATLMRRPYPPVYVGRKFVCWIAFCWMPAKWPILAGFPLFSRSLAGGIQESQKLPV